ncbi:MAG TPA: hypothetical protein VJY37_03825 [Anaerovoracaceae bacterium]|nr:hypothetical protein [Anaerovoracaceae bacterium]
MKKLLSLVFALALCMSLTTTAFAATTTAAIGDYDTNDVYGSGVNTANHSIIAMLGGAAAPVISVDVTWGDMVFLYGVNDVWNPSTHKYTRETAAWTPQGDCTVTVANHSNVAIKSTLTGGVDQQYSEGNVQVIITNMTDDTTGVTKGAAGIYTLGSAENTSDRLSGTGEATSCKYSVALSGAPTGMGETPYEEKAIGGLLVTITPANA